MPNVHLVIRLRDLWDAGVLPGAKDGTLFLAMDSAASHALRGRGLESKSLAEVLSPAERAAITRAVFGDIAARFVGPRETPPTLAAAFRYEWLDEGTTLALVAARVVAAARALAPARLTAFAPANVEEHVIHEALERAGFRVESVARSPSLKRDAVGRIGNALPFFGLERKFYETFVPSLFSPRSRLRRRPKTGLAALPDGAFDTIVGPIAFREDLLEVTETLGDEGAANTLVLLHPRLFEVDAQPLRDRGIPYVYLTATGQRDEASAAHGDVSAVAAAVEADIAPLLPASARARIAQNMASPGALADLATLRTELAAIVARTRPKRACLAAFFHPFARIAASVYRDAGIPTRAFVTALDQHCLGKRTLSWDLRGAEKDPMLPDEILVSDPAFEPGLARCLPRANDVRFVHKQASKMRQIEASLTQLRDRDANRRDVLVRLGLPTDGRLVAFTTQQHFHSFRYVALLAETFASLATDRHLVVKVHPKEVPLLYKLMTPRTKNVHIVKDEVSITSLLAASELVVTYFSFTAFEALALGTPVIRMNLTGSHMFPDLEPADGLETIETAAELRAALARHLRDQQRSGPPRS